MSRTTNINLYLISAILLSMTTIRGQTIKYTYCTQVNTISRTEQILVFQYTAISNKSTPNCSTVCTYCRTQKHSKVDSANGKYWWLFLTRIQSRRKMQLQQCTCPHSDRLPAIIFLQYRYFNRSAQFTPQSAHRRRGRACKACLAVNTRITSSSL